MDLQNLFILQKGVDKGFNKNCNMGKNSLLPEKILGLQVKISELVNQTQCYKFWVKENNFSNNKVLNEFVEGIHYILSIGLDEDYTNVHLDVQETQNDLTTQFINLYIDINDFVVCPNIDNYKTLFENFLSIGFSLGFEKETIEKAYLQKNLLLHKKETIAKS
ncbi:dUTP diphosphatase [Clostridium sediminicola]|uniref:dUTP diphosphatase n=1 Tax=Clostridium sediminicola TaxID=3114879 RepID=UPI0031F219C0